MNADPPIFAYDLGSPYAWLSAERVDDVFPSPPLWLPVLLGAIFQATGRSSWAETPSRADGIAEVERRAAERGLPAPCWPEPWPSNGLQAMRAAVHAHDIGAGREFALAAFRVHFTEGVSLSQESGVRRAADRAGLDADELIAATADAAVKGRLRANTERALALGVTGVPTFVAGGEVRWGDDLLDAAAS
jgi:2-hydroxychromene-2-carboxylate isomerase